MDCDAATTALTLAYASGADGHTVQLTLESPLVRLAERSQVAIELPAATVDALPRADRDWLSNAGVRLIVPMFGQ